MSAAAWSQNQRPHKPEIQAFDIINDEQQKEKHAANQFFSSLLGLHVEEDDLGPEFAGEIFRDEDTDSGYSIRVNSPDVLVRKRFTVAHEIAHYLLHRDRITDRLRDDNMYRSGLGDQREQAANRLAADLLMPAKVIRDLRAQGIGSPEEMSERLGVSLQAMRLRLGIRGRDH